MNDLTAVLYAQSPGPKEIKRLYVSAFPKEERLPWWILRCLSMRKGAAITGYYDGNAFCGFTFTASHGKILFVMFFAVNEDIRDKGYGSAILDFLKSKNPGKSIILNVELLEERASNYNERVRRIKFYEKNGFYDTKHNIDEVGGTFRVLSTEQKLDAKAYQRVFQALSFGVWKPRITRR